MRGFGRRVGLVLVTVTLGGACGGSGADGDGGGTNPSDGGPADARFPSAGGFDTIVDMTSDGEFLYVTDIGGFAPGAARIARVDKETLDVVWLATGQTFVQGLAIDGEFVYFSADEGSADAGPLGDGAFGSIRRVPKAGGPVESVTMGLHHPMTIAVDATHVYFGRGGTDRYLSRVVKTGGEAEFFMSTPDGVAEMSFSGGDLYAAIMERGCGSCTGPGCPPPEPCLTLGEVWRVATDGSGLVWSIEAPFATGVLVDDAHVFFRDCNSGACESTTVFRLSLAGTEKTWFGAFSSAIDIAQDDQALYVGEGARGFVTRFDKADGTPTMSEIGLFSDLRQLEVDEAHVYIATGTAILKLPK